MLNSPFFPLKIFGFAVTSLSRTTSRLLSGETLEDMHAQALPQLLSFTVLRFTLLSYTLFAACTFQRAPGYTLSLPFSSNIIALARHTHYHWQKVSSHFAVILFAQKVGQKDNLPIGQLLRYSVGKLEWVEYGSVLSFDDIFLRLFCLIFLFFLPVSSCYLFVSSMHVCYDHV